MDDPLLELRALTARLGPSQAGRALRRSGGLETLESRGRAAPDAEMLARHQYLTEQRAAPGYDPDLEFRQRQELEVLALQT